MRNLQAFFIEPDLVVRELPNGGVEIQHDRLSSDPTEVSRDQLADTILALRAVYGNPPGVEAGAQVDAVIKCLYEYGGFDSWWDSVELDDRAIIRTAITNLLSR